MPHPDRIMIFYDENSQVVKLVIHGVFDEDFNNLSFETIPSNCQHIQRINDNVCKEIGDDEIHSSNLHNIKHSQQKLHGAYIYQVFSLKKATETLKSLHYKFLKVFSLKQATKTLKSLFDKFLKDKD